MGLFLGVSFVSLVEIIYFALFRKVGISRRSSVDDTTIDASKKFNNDVAIINAESETTDDLISTRF